MLQTTHQPTQGVHHVGLTVLDLQRTCNFFTEILGFELAGGKPEYPAVFVSDGSVMVSLWQVEDPSAAAPFDRRGVIGLHHLALRVADANALDELHRRLCATEGVEVEFAPQPLDGGPAQHVICTIEGGLRLEFAAD